MLSADSERPLIAVNHLTYPGEGLALWQAVSFRINSGGLARIHGANGVGKSTFLRVLAGLLTPSVGQIQLDGQHASAAMRRQAVAYLGHQTGLKADLTVRENLELSCALHGRRHRLFPDHVLAMMHLDQAANSLTCHLSQGQQRRLALCRLWLSPAAIWLIDEPFANLDQAAQAIVHRMIAAHRRTGGVTIFTAHDCSESFEGAVVNVALRSPNETFDGKTNLLSSHTIADSLRPPAPLAQTR